MGNRATVVFADSKFQNFSPAVYLHWNGGPESVYQFLDELDRRKVRADQEYECARFIQIVGEFMDQDTRSGLSLGVQNGPATLQDAFNMSPGDNGVYIVSRHAGESPAGRMLVRRFKYDSEMDADWVASEERKARKHKYAKDGGFRKVWERQPIEAG